MARRRTPNADPEASLKRRDFLKAAGIGAGAMIVGGPEALPAEAPKPESAFPGVAATSMRVAVIGAGSFGVWTAYHLRKLGATVTLVDAYGPGNSRATSGDETRGVRSTYGDKAAPVGELWSHWARESMHRWPAFDAEWGPVIKTRLYWKTGDLYMRSDWEPTIKRSREIWEKAKVPFEVLTPDECHYRWPQINIEGINAILYEPDAGVVRARRAVQGVAAILTRVLGVKLVVAKAKPGAIIKGKMNEIPLINGDKLKCDAVVFACGPWLGKVFPELLGPHIRIPLGQVVYYGPPQDSSQYTFPNMPSFNFPGVTGWVALPEDARGFRVRGTESGGNANGGRAGATGTAGAAAGDTTGRGGRGANGGRGGADTTAAARGAGGGVANASRGAVPDTAGRGAASRGAAPVTAGAGAATTTPPARGNTQPATPPAPDPQSDPDRSVRWFDAVTNTRQREFVTRRFPGLKDAPILETRCCHYDGSSTRNFIIDRLPDTTNVWVAGGGNSEAFKSGPMIGEYVARRVLGLRTDPEIDKQFVFPTEAVLNAANVNGGGRGGATADTTGRGGRGGGGRGNAADTTATRGSGGGRGRGGAVDTTGRGGAGRGAGADTSRGGRSAGGGGGDE